MIAVDGFAERLLTWLGSLSLQAAVLVGLALLLAFAARRASPRMLHLIWLVVLLRLAIPIELSSPFGLLAEPSNLPAKALVSTRASAEALTGDAIVLTDGMASPNPGIRAGDRRLLQFAAPRGLASWLAAAWISGVVVLLGIVVVRVRRARRLLAAASAAGAPLLAEIAELSRRLEIEPPRVKIADPDTRLPAPAAFGLRRPTILLPEALATRWTAAEREPLLVHELAHLRRRDLWVNALQLIVQTLYFFHPLVWLANRSLRVARELACDEDVARFYGASSNRYARALLRAARGEASHFSSALAVTLATPRSLLGRRVQSLMTRRSSNPRRQWATLTAVLAGSVVIVALAAARPTRLAPEIEIPTDHKEWLAFVQELGEDPERRDAVGEALLEQVRSGEGDPELLEETLMMVRGPSVPFLGDRKARAAWQERLEILPRDLPTLRAASSFYTFEHRGRAEELLRQGWELQPGSAYWPVELAHIAYLERMGLSGQKNVEASKRALDLLEMARPLMTDSQLYPRLALFARAAYGAGELEAAREYALSLLDEAEEHRGKWYYGNALHHGHTVLGLVALAEGDRDEATHRLLLSADTPGGSPQLNSFGPSFKLAAELLELGERSAVLEYLDRCGVFWSSSNGRLESLTTAVLAGETPAFRELHF